MFMTYRRPGCYAALCSAFKAGARREYVTVAGWGDGSSTAAVAGSLAEALQARGEFIRCGAADVSIFIHALARDDGEDGSIVAAYAADVYCGEVIA